jgi:hypothetical protein
LTLFLSLGLNKSKGNMKRLFANKKKLGEEEEENVGNTLDRYIELPGTPIKKKVKFSSYIRKFRMEQLQSHI